MHFWEVQVRGTVGHHGSIWGWQIFPYEHTGWLQVIILRIIPLSPIQEPTLQEEPIPMLFASIFGTLAHPIFEDFHHYWLLKYFTYILFYNEMHEVNMMQILVYYQY